MKELILFCKPGEIYQNKLEKNISKEYQKIFVKEFDHLITFDEDYSEFLKTPDYQFVIGHKEKRDLGVKVFFNQPVKKIGRLKRDFLSSSYIFNPRSKNKKLLLPDLEIVQLSGKALVKEGIQKIKKFYENNGWETYTFDEKIKEKMRVKPTSTRFDEPIKILSPYELREIATEKLGYNPRKLCF